MKLYAYYNDNGEIKQTQVEVKEKVILVPEKDGDSLPFLYEKSLDRDKVGVPIGYLSETLFFTNPSFDRAKEIFMENVCRRLDKTKEEWAVEECILKNLRAQEEPHDNQSKIFT